MLAIAAIEGGLRLPRIREVRPHEDVPVAGILELRRGAMNTLERGATLAGRAEEDLRADTDLGTEAGVRVLAELRPESTDAADVAAWAPAVRAMSGLADAHLEATYLARVYRLLRTGGTLPARDGEIVTIAPHPEVPIAMTIAPPPRTLLDTPDSSVVTEWVATPMSAGGSGKWDTSHDQKDYVAIHDTEGGWDASLATLKNDGGKSVQYMIDADGSRVAQFIHETAVGYHLGNYWYNQRSIGIEHVGSVSNKAGYSKAMYDVSVALVKDITKRWKMPVDRAHVFGHYQAPGNGHPQDSPPCSAGLDACESDASYGGAGHHTDPGYYWQWCQYMERLGGSCNCNDAWPDWNCTSDLTQAWRCSGGKLQKQECTGPKKCTVEAIGTPDVCDTSGGSGGGGGSAGAAGAAGAGGAAGKAGAAGAAGSSSGAGGAAGKGGAGAAGASAGAAGSSAGAAGATSTGGASGASAGGASAGSAGAGASTAGSAGAGGPNVIVVDDAGEDGGGCATSAPRSTSSWWAISIGCALVAARRRRRAP